MRINNRGLKRDKAQHEAKKTLIAQWDKLLAGKGLSTNRGLSNRLSYAGTSQDLVVIEKYQKGATSVR